MPTMAGRGSRRAAIADAHNGRARLRPSRHGWFFASMAPKFQESHDQAPNGTGSTHAGNQLRWHSGPTGPPQKLFLGILPLSSARRRRPDRENAGLRNRLRLLAAIRSGRLRRLLRRRILLRYRLIRRWRVLRGLIRLLVRSRLIGRLDHRLYLTPGRMQFLVKIFSRLAEFVHALPQAPRQFRKFFGTKQDQHYYQNEYPFRWPRSSKREHIHYVISFRD
jgi:hypothetical protein